MICPFCNGEKQLIGLGCGDNGCCVIEPPCFYCNSTGEIDGRYPEWKQRGDKCKERRIARHTTMRTMCLTLNLDAVQMTYMELGLADPTPLEAVLDTLEEPSANV